LAGHSSSTWRTRVTPNDPDGYYASRELVPGDDMLDDINCTNVVIIN